MTTPQIQQLDSLEDFELLNQNTDCVLVNGTPSLYRGRNADKKIILLRRAGDMSFVETAVLDESRVRVKNGEIRYAGEHIVKTKLIPPSHLAYDSRRDYFNDWEEVGSLDKLMKGAGL